MEVRITDRHGRMTAAVKKYAIEKLEPLSRYWARTRYLEVVFDEAHLGWKIEAIAHVERGAPLVATVEHKDALAAVDLAHDKIERLLTRAKERVEEKRQGNARGAGAGSGER